MSTLHLGAHVRMGPMLGQGAAATVFKGVVVETGEILAIKRLLGRVRVCIILFVFLAVSLPFPFLSQNLQLSGF